jgi:cell division transport system permease protein
MNIWLTHHIAAFNDALRHLGSKRSGFLFNVIVVAIALALPFAGLTVLDNVRPVSEQLAVDPEISIFLKLDTPRERAAALAPQIRRVASGAASSSTLEFITREAALETLKNKTGMADVVAALGSNPLPDTYVLRLAGFRNADDARRVDIMADELKALAGVDVVQVDSAWAKRLAALLQVMRLALLLLAGTLGVVVVAVVFNTIRLQVLNQHEEIEISRLVGATDAYICRPFYYSGALLGLCAGLLALGAVTLSLQPLNGAIAEFARLYASDFQLAPLPVLTIAGLLALSACLGLIGALLSVRRHLARLS